MTGQVTAVNPCDGDSSPRLCNTHPSAGQSPLVALIHFQLVSTLLFLGALLLHRSQIRLSTFPLRLLLVGTNTDLMSITDVSPKTNKHQVYASSALNHKYIGLKHL